LKAIKSLKLKIISDLEKIIYKNKNVCDIWLYGSFKDVTSDIDLILIYQKKPPKIYFPTYIKKLVDDGNVIYLNKLNKEKIFLFEPLKIYSILKKKKITKKLNYIEKKYRYLTSFLERYYHSRIFLNKKKIKLDNRELRKIKSLLFSYKTFFKIQLKKKIYISFKNIEKKYYELREQHNLGVLKKINYNIFTRELKNFDIIFSNNAYNYFEKKSSNINLKNHILKFNNTFKFEYQNKFSNKKITTIKIPKLFFMIYFFYASQKLNLSNKIYQSFSNVPISLDRNLNIFFSKNLKKFLLKKIIFLNLNYLPLKNYNFKGGLYRFGWYL
jgi:hypothetical protein